MKTVMKVASAFIGIIIGAGFASGQEVLQYFTSFGYKGTIGALVSTVLFGYAGMMLTRLGSRFKATSHKEAINPVSGPLIGLIVDIVIIFTLFGVGTVMIAGAGATLEQQFSIPPFVGSLIMTVLIVLTIMLDVDKFIAIIGSITPFLIVALLIITIYSLTTFEGDLGRLNSIANSVETPLPNWFIASINYVSFNLAVGASMAIVMGGSIKNERQASLGGFLGGIGIGVLIMIAHLSIFSKIDLVKDFDMPLLKIVTDLSPLLGFLMTFILFGMIFNTGASMFYAFIARFSQMQTPASNRLIVITGGSAFIVSFIGFTNLVAKFYTFIGYIGLVLLAVLIYAPFKLRKVKDKSNTNGVNR